jgi:cell shape-determining protein MreC
MSDTKIWELEILKDAESYILVKINSKRYRFNSYRDKNKRYLEIRGIDLETGDDFLVNDPSLSGIIFEK